MRLEDFTLSAEALAALRALGEGKICIPSEEVVTELGRAGLAYRRDLRSRSRRIALTTGGAIVIALAERDKQHPK